MGKKFTIEVHHKRRAELPQWMLDNFTIKSTFQKRTGPTDKSAATDAMVERARRKMDDGMTAAQAAADTAAFMRSRANVSKLYKDRPAGMFRGKWYPADKPGEGLYRAILTGLTHKKKGRR